MFALSAYSFTSALESILSFHAFAARRCCKARWMMWHYSDCCSAPLLAHLTLRFVMTFCIECRHAVWLRWPLSLSWIRYVAPRINEHLSVGRVPAWVTWTPVTCVCFVFKIYYIYSQHIQLCWSGWRLRYQTKVNVSWLGFNGQWISIADSVNNDAVWLLIYCVWTMTAMLYSLWRVSLIARRCYSLCALSYLTFCSRIFADPLSCRRLTYTDGYFDEMIPVQQRVARWRPANWLAACAVGLSIWIMVVTRFCDRVTYRMINCRTTFRCWKIRDKS